ncbi:hypothetical protein COU56_03110 [Candidatus Pacearchaeota archaeon CG10_big_fil_rev_8_21_14_0_10_31_9]|nr:MAG: hypothetical protein COU56_03110 [Candidatus Pacearchaeota archaeon CG10_big_fil_rev_8_21_14_0_10_31_9]PIZ82972.1 MAG: hypothetical protein COX97_02105 [Candidatus Pacearchaeota archaeon CG_4_10_14_0_2_um_filter_05_32_18]
MKTSKVPKIRSFTRLVPGKLKIPGVIADVSYTKQEKQSIDTMEMKRREVREEGQVVYDTRNHEFYLYLNDKRYPMIIRDEDKIPTYMFNRIQVYVPKDHPLSVKLNLRRRNKDNKETIEAYCFFDPYSRTWSGPNPERQPIPQAYDSWLYRILQNDIKEELDNFNINEGRTLKKEILEKLAGVVVRSMSRKSFDFPKGKVGSRFRRAKKMNKN